ncbi:unnamed protein product [Oncorhynchus mykiss]|uniref:Uncharacterized protein n=1 Tax=Oncorhynchus mykiss TaxID=8022 RepID=A0A060XTB5_ONCMY|nr:unnamed protein product [Oncorhynchus mykiss]
MTFSTICCFQCRFWPHNHRPCVWCRVCEQFADVNVVNRVPHGGGGVMVWADISYGQ